MIKSKIKNIPEFLLENGLLFEINRKVLHPVGLAIEVIVDDDDKIAFGDIWDHRDDPEGIIFSEESFNIGKEKHDKFMRFHGEARVKTREKILGFVVQETADLMDHSIHDTSIDLTPPLMPTGTNGKVCSEPECGREDTFETLILDTEFRSWCGEHAKHRGKW